MRFAAFVAVLAAAAAAFGAVVVPRLADDSVPDSLQPSQPTLIQQKLEDDRCRDRHERSPARVPARFPGT